MERTFYGHSCTNGHAFTATAPATFCHGFTDGEACTARVHQHGVTFTLSLVRNGG